MNMPKVVQSMSGSELSWKFSAKQIEIGIRMMFVRITSAKKLSHTIIVDEAVLNFHHGRFVLFVRNFSSSLL